MFLLHALKDGILLAALVLLLGLAAQSHEPAEPPITNFSAH